MEAVVAAHIRKHGGTTRMKYLDAARQWLGWLMCTHHYHRERDQIREVPGRCNLTTEVQQLWRCCQCGQEWWLDVRQEPTNAGR